METVYSTVKIRLSGQEKKVKIGGKNIPEISKPFEEKWQSMIDTIATILEIPSCLIMRLHEDDIEIFLTSNSPANIFRPHSKVSLLSGLYCETVIGSQCELAIADARKDPLWCHDNPNLERNLIAYLGYPINWPNGVVFGSLCLFDSKVNDFPELTRNLVKHLKLHIEADLKLIYANKKINQKSYEFDHTEDKKNRILSTISHEIRSEMDYMNSFLTHLEKTNTTDSNNSGAEIMDSVRSSANEIMNKIDSIIAWTRKDYNNFVPNKSIVNVNEVFERLFSYFALPLKIKNITIDQSIPEDSILIECDEQMVETALRNIISNAIKYSRYNSEIRIKLQQKNRKTYIEIQDFGVGMTKQTIDALFAKNSDEDCNWNGVNGSGIGLFLANEFLEINNASVVVESALEQGTRFVISF